MDKQTAIKKIQKCLALSKSSEPNEAAAALRQAQKLMEQFDVEHPELLASSVSESWSKSSVIKTPPRYEVRLASMIARAFGCELMFSRQLSASQLSIDGGYSFIGVSAAPEVASYSYCVLRRQLKKARGNYIRTALNRHRKNKTAAADIYCEGWVSSVQDSVLKANVNKEHKESIDAYKQLNYADTKQLQVKKRTIKADDAWRHHRSGLIDGQNVKLTNGIAQPQFDLLN